jgi:hypothetical protein
LLFESGVVGSIRYSNANLPVLSFIDWFVNTYYIFPTSSPSMSIHCVWLRRHGGAILCGGVLRRHLCGHPGVRGFCCPSPSPSPPGIAIASWHWHCHRHRHRHLHLNLHLPYHQFLASPSPPGLAIAVAIAICICICICVCIAMCVCIAICICIAIAIASYPRHALLASSSPSPSASASPPGLLYLPNIEPLDVNLLCVAAQFCEAAFAAPFV